MCNSKMYNGQFDLQIVLSIGYSSIYNWIQYIDVAPIMQLRKCAIKNSNIQGRSPNVAKVISMP